MAGRDGPGVAGVGGALAVRGGGRPGPPDAGTPGEDGARWAAAGLEGVLVRGHAGMVPVGIRSGARGTAPGDPVLLWLPVVAG